MNYFIDNDLSILTSAELKKLTSSADFEAEMKEAQRRFFGDELTTSHLKLLKELAKSKPFNERYFLQCRELEGRVNFSKVKRFNGGKNFSAYKMNNKVIEDIKQLNIEDFDSTKTKIKVNKSDYNSFKSGDNKFLNLNRDLDNKENNQVIIAPSQQAEIKGDISFTRITAKGVSEFSNNTLLLTEKPILTRTETALINAIGVKLFFSIPQSRRSAIFLHNKTHNGAKRLAMYRDIEIPLEDIIYFYPHSKDKNRYKAINKLTIDLERLQRTFVNTPLPYKEKGVIGRTRLDYPFNIITGYKMGRNKVEIYLNDYLVYFMLKGCIEANNRLLQAVYDDQRTITQSTAFLKISEMLNHLATQKREKFYFYVSIKKLVVSSGMLTAEEFARTDKIATNKKGKVAKRICDYLNYLEDYYILFLENDKEIIDYPEREKPKKILESKLCVQKYNSDL